MREDYNSSPNGMTPKLANNPGGFTRPISLLQIHSIKQWKNYNDLFPTLIAEH